MVGSRASDAKLGEPSERQPLSSKENGKAPSRKEEEEAAEEKEAEDRGRTVSSAPMGEGDPQGQVLLRLPGPKRGTRVVLRDGDLSYRRIDPRTY
ncbi:hypothetical protein CDL15_Pgr015893 [Punica granatum]|uniref:Uncharacterized protein n=1 Tax=Punica granatum TaxID=22663 RepID=A0A218XPE6_PUNGR|nr:hypothetical protein CDL15_Pgr015893 [Punica granatum]